MMSTILKYNWQKSIAFGLYSILVVVLFNPFTFIGVNLGVLLLTIQFALFFGLIFLTMSYFSWGDDRKNLIFRTASDLLVSLIVGLLILMLFGKSFEHSLVFTSTYVILPIPVIAIRVLDFLLNDFKSKVKFETNRDDNLDEDIKLKITNEAGKVLLNISFSKVICFEANDNYVITYYLSNDGDLKRSMERISLKKIEDLIKGFEDSFYRVHKSYIVNSNYVEKITGRSQAYKLKISYLEELVPVSRSFDIELIKP